MRRARVLGGRTVLAGAVFLAACGSGSRTAAVTHDGTPTAVTRHRTAARGAPEGSGTAHAIQDLRLNGKSATIAMAVPGLASGATVKVGKTCDQHNVPPALTWGRVPANAAELDLFAVRVGSATHEAASVAWAAAGLKPSAHEVAEGARPLGAIVSRAAYRKPPFTICPIRGGRATYLFILFASPNRQRLKSAYREGPLFYSLYHSPAPYGAVLLTYTRS